MNPRDKKDWSARDLANVVFCADLMEVSKFSSYVRVHRPSNVSDALEEECGPKFETVKEPPLAEDGMEMDIDDNNSRSNLEQEYPFRSHILDRLHLEIIEYFSPILFDITKGAVPEAFVGMPSSRAGGAIASIHSPYKPSRNKKWTACECLEVLTDGGTKSCVPASSSLDSQAGTEYVNQLNKGWIELGAFLTLPYEGRGRRGQDWTLASWEGCLRTLYSVGVVWKSELMRSSLDAVWQELTDSINMAMKPTGM